MNALDPIIAAEVIAPIAALSGVAGAQAPSMAAMQVMLQFAGRVA